MAEASRVRVAGYAQRPTRRRRFAIATTIMFLVGAIGAPSVRAGTPTTTTILYYPTSPIVANSVASFTAKIEPSVAGRPVEWTVNGEVAETDLTNPNGVSEFSFSFGPGGYTINAILQAGADYDRSQGDAVNVTVTPDPAMAPNMFSIDPFERPATTAVGSDMVVHVNRLQSSPSVLVLEAIDTASGTRMMFSLGAPTGSILAAGSYPNANSSRQVLSDPELRVSVSPSCDGPSFGAFQILSIRFDSAGIPVSFAISFESLCDSRLWPTIGHIRYNAADAIPSLTLPEGSPRLDSVIAGQVGVPRVFPMTNDGDVPVRLGRLAIVGPDANDFDLTADDCSERTLAQDAECSFSVTAHPSTPGFRSATLVIPSDTPLAPRKLSLGVWGLIATSLSDPVAIADNQYFLRGVRYEAVLEPITEWNVIECIVDGVPIGGSSPDRNGRVFCNAPRPPVGSHQLRIHYLGSHTHGESWSETVGFTVDSTGGIRMGVPDPDTDPPSGSILIAAGDAYAASTSVSVGVGATDTGSGVTQVALSNDNTNWTMRPYDANHTWALAAGDGMKTVYAKWKDGAGNWSAAATDTIVLDPTAPMGSATIAGGAAFTVTTSVIVANPANDALSGVTHVRLSNDGATWTTRAYAPSQAWTLAATNGTRTVHVEVRDGAGNWSATKTDTIVLDTAAPTTTVPTQELDKGAATAAGGMPVRLNWAGADATSGLARFELAQSTDGGAWSTLAANLTVAGSIRSLAPDHAYRFRVRAVDRAGNIGQWIAGASVRLGAYSEASARITYGGSWSVTSSSAFVGGAARRTSAPGASATYAFNGRSVGWLAVTGPTLGKVRVFVDGVDSGVVDLYRPTAAARQVVVTRSWSSIGSHTVRLVNLGTPGHPTAVVDGFYSFDGLATGIVRPVR